MKALLSKMGRKEMMIGLSWLLVFSLIYSRFLVSVGMIGFLLLALLDYQKEGWRLNPALASGWQTFQQNRALQAVTCLFFIVLLGGLYSEDWPYFFERLRIKLPFLLLPFAFAILPALNKRAYLSIFYFLLLICSISCVGVAINFGMNYEQIMDGISKGQAIPTPVNHIRYSLLLAFATLSGALLYAEGYYWREPRERYLILLLSLGLLLFIHLLSVRSGLLVLYLSIVVMALRHMWKTRSWRLGLLALGLVVALPVIAFFTIPSFKAKLYYAEHDWRMYWRGEGASYSDSERLLSYQVGWQIVKDNPLIGIGSGDLRRAVREGYQHQFPEVRDFKMPHNQLLSVLAGAGFLGLLLFLLAFFIPLFYQNAYRDSFLLVLHIVVFLSFMVENTIENSIGVAFYVFFLLLGLNYGRSKLE